MSALYVQVLKDALQGATTLCSCRDFAPYIGLFQKGSFKSLSHFAYEIIEVISLLVTPIHRGKKQTLNKWFQCETLIGLRIREEKYVSA